MSEIKNFILGTIFGVCLFGDANAYPHISDFKFLTPLVKNDAKIISEHRHNRKCNFIIEDSYHQDIRYHFVNDYVENVNGSISFIGHDGLIWTIPAPYYWIYRNNKN